MEKEFVPYEQALELKVLGFNEPCLALYWNTGKFYTTAEYISVFSTHQQNQLGDYNLDSTSAPMWQQAFKWILEKHSIYCLILPTITMDWTFKTMTVVSDMIDVPPYSHVHHTDYSTREEAELECLKRLIEMVKDK